MNSEIEDRGSRKNQSVVGSVVDRMECSRRWRSSCCFRRAAGTPPHVVCTPPPAEQKEGHVKSQASRHEQFMTVQSYTLPDQAQTRLQRQQAGGRGLRGLHLREAISAPVRGLQVRCQVGVRGRRR